MPAISAAQIEHAIEFPADGQVEVFLDFEWLVPQVDGQWWSNQRDPLFPTHYCFTSPERMEPLRAANETGRQFAEQPYPLVNSDGWNLIRPMNYQAALDRCQLVPIRGRELFAQLAATRDYHELQINVGGGTYDAPTRGGSLCLVSGNTRQLAQGLDPRPGTRILRARSIAEIHLFMRSFLQTSELTHRLEYVSEKLVAVYEGLDLQQKPRRQAFWPVEPPPDPLDYGPGVSTILCGGLMAQLIESHHSTLRGNFHPATRAHLHRSTPEILRQIDELLKMLAPQTDRLGPEHFRSESSVPLVRIKPHLIEGAWLRQIRPEFAQFLAEPAP